MPLFVLFDLWMARKVYKKVTGREAPANARLRGQVVGSAKPRSPRR